MASIRSSQELRRPAISDAPIPQAITRRAQAFSEVTGLPLRCRVSGTAQDGQRLAATGILPACICTTDAILAQHLMRASPFRASHSKTHDTWIAPVASAFSFQNGGVRSALEFDVHIFGHRYAIRDARIPRDAVGICSSPGEGGRGRCGTVQTCALLHALPPHVRSLPPAATQPRSRHRLGPVPGSSATHLLCGHESVAASGVAPRIPFEGRHPQRETVGTHRRFRDQYDVALVMAGEHYSATVQSVFHECSGVRASFEYPQLPLLRHLLRPRLALRDIPGK
jgi:hypothetical protein